MAQVLLPEELWSLIAAQLPNHCRSPKGGRPRINDRAARTRILFVLKTGIPCEYLPRELGCGSGMTCSRRLHEWMQAGVWQCVHEAVLRRLREHDQMMWDQASIDAASIPAPCGGEHTGRNPTDRGKLGCKHHVVVDQRGLPLVARISGAQVHDSRCSYRLSRRSRLSKACQAELVSVLGNYTLIEPTLRERIELGCAGRGLRQGSRVTAWSHANGLGDGGGSWSALLAGFTDFADYVSAMSVEPTFTKPSFR